MIRLESIIGDKRVPLWYELVRISKTVTALVESQCMSVSCAAPIWVYADEVESVSVDELVKALKRAGFWKIEVVMPCAQQ